MNGRLDSGRLDDAKKNVVKAINQIEKDKSILTKKYIKLLEKEIHHIIESEIIIFYKSYLPHIYDRKKDLHNVYKIEAGFDDKTSSAYIYVDFDEKYMKHTHDDENEYVFYNSFIEGNHGGQIDGEDHPQPGVAWWRWKGVWLRPAVVSISPYKIISVKIDKTVSRVQKEMQNEYNERMQKYINKIQQSVSKIVK